MQNKSHFDIFFAHLVKNLTAGHPSSGHQARSSDSISKKVCNRVTVTVVEMKISKSQELVYHLVQGWKTDRFLVRFAQALYSP